jgi:hypothetical protein
VPAHLLVDPGLTRRVARRLLVAGALAGALATGCSTEHGLLLDVTADQSFTRLRVEVKGPEDEPFFWEEFDVPQDPERDLTMEPYRLAIRLPSSGRYGVHVVDVSLGPASQTWSGRFDIDGIVEAEARLRPYPLAGDEDGDGWPDSCWTDAPPGDCVLLDCDDLDAGVHPFAVDECGNLIDEDCSGTPRPCADEDGDGYDESLDCDDHDEDVHPREPGFCEGVPPLCGNGKDDDCQGGDAVCGTDEDCDGWAECENPLATMCDCDDADPDVNPEAAEVCLDTIDTDCDGDPDNGCDRCDEDGDGFYGEHPERGCTVAPEFRDCDDMDRGVHPAATEDCGGQEGAPACAARGYCNGAVDDDCDGVANDGCPAPGCDVDGDGYAPFACGPSPALTDCDDEDATRYPGAPDVCGDGILQNCSIDLPCTADSDGDGYNASAECDDTDNGVNPSQVEVCDGVDQDCDGLIDEGNPSLEEGVSLDAFGCNDDNDGQCAPTTGRCVCSTTVPDGLRQVGNRVECPDEIEPSEPVGPRCFGAPQPTPEECDAQDDDCDTDVDEALVRPCSTICGEGMETCFTGSWSCDAPVPTAEICDGLNNDCDADIDEGLGLGTPCDGADSDQCNEGTIVCDGGGGTECSDATGGTVESCNSMDDDCDGSIDEGFGAGVACDGADTDLCTEGLTVCNMAGTGVVCNDTTGNNAEICNGADDDCDGTTDEGFTLGASCDGSDGDLCEEGVTVCNMAGTATVCGDTTGTNAELCNYLDDDCDGTTDEGFTLGGMCDGADGDLCEEGMVVCNVAGTGTVCSDATGTISETCNGSDDDCDGTADDPPTNCLTGQRCSGGSCVCDSMSCAGCCSGTSCSAGNTTSSCGIDGDACVNCTTLLADNCGMGMCRCGTSPACDPTKANACSMTAGCQCYGGPACTGTQICCAAHMECRSPSSC